MNCARFLFLTLLVCWLAVPSFSQGTVVGNARLLGITKPLRDKIPSTGSANALTNKEKYKKNKPVIPNFQGKKTIPELHKSTALPKGEDPIRQPLQPAGNGISVLPQLTIDGINQATGIAVPPDPNGYIGSNYYIQATNGPQGSAFIILDKEGNLVYGPANSSMLWEDLGVTGLGDPIILFDHEMNRWLITEFGFFGDNTFLVAVSVTDDPLGNWYAYELQAADFPDYPKYAIWPNAYLITTNEGFDHIPVYALNRLQLINGNPNVEVQRLDDIPKFGAFDAFEFGLPATWDGPTPPPANSPGYVVRIYDDAWQGGLDGLELWEINIDWNNPANSGASGPFFLPTAPFDSKLCDVSIYECILQQDGFLVSALEQIIMHRVQYRNFGSYESIVLNHSVDVDGNNTAGIRWYELRKQPGGDWFVYQQGTWSPDNMHRFMGSISQDINGNILLGFSTMGDGKWLSLRYTGRLAADPLGTLTIDEHEFGTGSSGNQNGRWGDYACMTVDPTDQRTFWFTGEYMLDNNAWGTKITKVLIQRDSNDVGPFAVIQPQNSGYLTSAEPVTVAIRNYGYKPAYDFEVGLIFNGNLLATEVFADTIAPDSTKLHTFTPTVDMATIGDYPFKIFTSYELDTLIINDTLRTVVSQLPRHDAAIIGYEGIGTPICDKVVNLGIVLANKGVDPLTSVNIHYQINGGNSLNLPWTGILEPNETTTINITSNEIVNGDNTVAAVTELPNGFADENPANDQLEQNFTVVTDGSRVVLQLLTDLFPNETTWDIKDLNGNVLYEGGPYDVEQNLYIHELCLGNGCYRFTIYDSFGDGITWDGISGNYQIINSEGIVVAALMEPAFGSQEINDFCTNFECMLVAGASSGQESAPGEQDGYILSTATNGLAPFRYSINNGASFQTAALFQNLAGGVYTLIAKDARNCQDTTTVEVGTCLMEVTAQVSPAATVNSNDGAIALEAINGTAPYLYRINNSQYQNNPNFTGLDVGVYNIRVKDASNCLRDLQVEVSPVVSTRQSFYGSSVKVYPNPTSSGFKIDLKGWDSLATLPVKIYDATGKLVHHARLSNFNGVLMGNVSLQMFPSGVYFVRLQIEGETDKLVRVVKE
jgi:hypothetical protein